MTIKKILLLLICINSIFISPVKAGPSLVGDDGFISTPSANILSDRDINLGLTYLPGARSYLFTGKPNLMYSLFIGFIPKTEFGIVFNQVFGWATPDNPYLANQSSFDRSIYLKVQLLKEDEFIPSLAIGGRDIISNSVINRDREGPTSSLQQTFYIVTGKTFSNFRFNIGYAYAPEIPFGFEQIDVSKEVINKGFRVNGFFGAMETPKLFSLLSAIIEYDSKYINYGFDIGPLYNLNLKIAMIDLYNFNLRLSWVNSL